MLSTLIGLSLFMLVEGILLYLGFVVGKGTITKDVIEPTGKVLVKIKNTIIKPKVEQHEVYAPTDEELFRNEVEAEEEANEKIDEGLKTLRNLKDK